jgi:hypothetical protein
VAQRLQPEAVFTDAYPCAPLRTASVRLAVQHCVCVNTSATPFNFTRLRSGCDACPERRPSGVNHTNTALGNDLAAALRDIRQRVGSVRSLQRWRPARRGQPPAVLCQQLVHVRQQLRARSRRQGLQESLNTSVRDADTQPVSAVYVI